MEASGQEQMPAPGATARNLVSVPDSLRDDRRGMRRLDLMVNTVFERLVGGDDSDGGSAAGRAL